MSYTLLVVLAIPLVVVVDLFVLRTRLLTRRLFWVTYAIVVVFQLASNAALTGPGIVRYRGDVIVGTGSWEGEEVPFLGGGRVFFAPIEDLGFGFAMVLLTLVLWVAWGRAGVDREPRSGPPRLRLNARRREQPSGERD